MHQNYPSVSASTKELRLLLRRINKSIRILDSDLADCFHFQNQISIDSESLNQLSDLICSKALQKSQTASDEICEEDPSTILNELL